MATFLAAALCVPDLPLGLEEWTRACESAMVPSETNSSGQNQATFRKIVVNTWTH